MNRKSPQNSAKALSHTMKSFKSDDPMLMRKTFRMEDTFYRKNSPSDEVVKVEFGMEAEYCVLVVAAVALGALVMYKIVKAAKRSSEKRQMKRRMCKKGS